MLVEAHVTINGSKSAVWAVVADIAGAANVLTGVQRIDVLETPTAGLVGLKWRETRELFGKSASVEKWIASATPPTEYTTRAESDGFVFVSTMRLAETSNGVTLTSVHDSLPQTLATRLMSIPMGLFFKPVARKALMQDLTDIKTAVERGTHSPTTPRHP